MSSTLKEHIAKSLIYRRDITRCNRLAGKADAIDASTLSTPVQQQAQKLPQIGAAVHLHTVKILNQVVTVSNSKLSTT